MVYSQDAFLGGRLLLSQPKTGYRSGSDAVLLAAFLCASPKQKILDMGCGAGVVLACVLRRLPLVEGYGFDQNTQCVELAEKNLYFNKLTGTVWQGRVEDRPQESYLNFFDHILFNPPYYPCNSYTPPKEEHRKFSRWGDTLSPWIKASNRYLKPKGSLSFIYPTRFLDEVLGFLKQNSFGSIYIIPLWPKENICSKRMLVRAIKGSKGPLTLSSGIILHNIDGSLTTKALSLLKEGNGFLDVLS